jgi:hypothetical protein
MQFSRDNSFSLKVISFLLKREALEFNVLVIVNGKSSVVVVIVVVLVLVLRDDSDVGSSKTRKVTTLYYGTEL